MVDATNMTQDERLDWLIDALRAERREYADIETPVAVADRRALLRALMNVRPPDPIDSEFLAVQDAYLQDRLVERGVTRTADLAVLEHAGAGELCLWQGDITTLAADAIVNAANAQMLGCFVPGHHCIDNAIHTYAGVQLRLACAELMVAQGHEEPTGMAKITPGFNLPAAHVLHTVGPIVARRVDGHDRELLAGCYRSCLSLAADRGLASVAFCCISTGVFHFPGDEAARVAIATTRAFLKESGASLRVVFNVFLDRDRTIYEALLG